MFKKKFLIPALILLLCVAGGSVAYLLKSKATLQASLTETQKVTKNEIDELKKQIEELKEVPVVATKETEVEPIETNSETIQTEAKEIPATQSPLVSPPTIENEIITETSQFGPILTAAPEVFDLGMISKKNGLATATFELKNTGTSDLTISYAFTSCGCTIAPIKEEKVLKPGEIYEMAVTYDPNFYGPDYELGNIEKTVTIISNYSGKPFYKVKLKAVVTA